MRREISPLVFAGLVMFSMGLTVSSTRQLWHSVAWVEHSDTVLLELEALLSLVKDAETGERAYLPTGKPDYLAPYVAASAGLQTRLDTLPKPLTATPTAADSLPAAPPWPLSWHF